MFIRFGSRYPLPQFIESVKLLTPATIGSERIAEVLLSRVDVALVLHQQIF
jgi:hypothetical protein